VSDAAIFAIMARVNKVIVGCSAVLANGGIVSHVGMHNIALAAKHHSVPFVVCTGMFKLSPTFPHDQYSLSELTSPVRRINPELHKSQIYMTNIHMYICTHALPNSFSLFH